jgi:hypothetical protein
LFPRHFAGNGDSGGNVTEFAGAMQPAASAHRQTIGAALQRRLTPAGALTLAELSEIGNPEGVLSWLEGVTEPTRELGRCCGADRV